MYLGIRTDSPVAEFYLYDQDKQIARSTWQADRALAKHLLAKLETFLTENGGAFDSLKGLLVFKGPGSFTGLRIGLTVMNTMAYSLAIPIVGSEGENWQNDAVSKLLGGQNDTAVFPHYGADPRITKPKK